MIVPSPSKVRIWLAVGCFVSIATFAYWQVQSSGNFGGGLQTNPWVHLVQLFVAAGSLLAIVFLRKTSTLPERLVALVLLTPVLFVYVTGWTRRPAQAILLAGLAYYSVSKPFARKTQVRIGLLAAAVALLLSVAQGTYRSVSMREEFSMRYFEYYLHDYWEDIRIDGVIDSFQVACAVTYFYPEKRSYLYGESVWGVLANPIPRRFWANKPVGFGYSIAQDIYGVERPPSNFGPSIVGEFYANGGFLAVVLAMSLIGFLCKSYDFLLLRAHQSESSVVIHAAGLYQFFFLVRGDFLDAAYAFLSVVPPLFLALVWLRPDPIVGRACSPRPVRSLNL
jgi:hypothetical protein